MNEENKIVLTEDAFETLFTTDSISQMEHEELLEYKFRLKAVVEYVRIEKYSIDKDTVLRLAGEKVAEKVAENV